MAKKDRPPVESAVSEPTPAPEAQAPEADTLTPAELGRIADELDAEPLTTEAEASEPEAEPIPANVSESEKACELVAKGIVQIATLAEFITHSHGAPAERLAMQEAIRQAGSAASKALRANVSWHSTHIDLAEAPKAFDDLLQTLGQLEVELSTLANR